MQGIGLVLPYPGGYNSIHHSKPWLPSNSSFLVTSSRLFWTVQTALFLGKLQEKNSAFLAGEEEQKHDLLVQGRGHLDGQEAAWTLLSTSRTVLIFYPVPGDITEQGQEQGQQVWFRLSRDF